MFLKGGHEGTTTNPLQNSMETIRASKTVWGYQKNKKTKLLGKGLVTSSLLYAFWFFCFFGTLLMLNDIRRGWPSAFHKAPVQIPFIVKVFHKENEGEELQYRLLKSWRYVTRKIKGNSSSTDSFHFEGMSQGKWRGRATVQIPFILKLFRRTILVWRCFIRKMKGKSSSTDSFHVEGMLQGK